MGAARSQRASATLGRSMPVYLCRWPNGEVSIVQARDKTDAIFRLDEFDNAEGL